MGGFGELRRDQVSNDEADDTSSASTAQPAQKDPFAKGPAYAPALPKGNARAAHSSGNVGVVPAKEAQCLGCHGDAPAGDAAKKAPMFVFAGTVYESAEGKAPAKDMELGLVDQKDKQLRVHSDDDGNFWIEGDTDLAFPAFVAVRVGTTTKAMKKRINNMKELECNSCHGNANPIRRP